MKVATERVVAMMENDTAHAGIRRPARKYSSAPDGSRRANHTPETSSRARYPPMTHQSRVPSVDAASVIMGGMFLRELQAGLRPARRARRRTGRRSRRAYRVIGTPRRFCSRVCGLPRLLLAL